MEPFTMVGPTASADGYGVACESMVLAATRMGADINFIEHDWRDARWTDPVLLKLRVPEYRAHERDVIAVMFLPFALSRFRSRVTISMTMWETDRLPWRWVTCAPLANGLIVPSEHCRTVFEADWACPIEVVPFGTDPDFYQPVDRTDRERFIFLMAGLLHYRKGLEFALRAFREEFRPSENAQLILKTRRGFLDAGSEAHTLGDPRVHIIDADHSREQMRDLYQVADCFLAPSRGEGSGLTPRDAMATGLPVVLTDWGGLREIANPECNWPIPIDCLEPAPQECSSYQAGVTGGGQLGNFARPDIAAMRAAMREAYEDRPASRQRGILAAEYVRREFNWNICARKWLAAMERLSVGAHA